MGLSKEEAAKKMGESRVTEWRRSWEHAPPPMYLEDMYEWESALWARPVTIICEPGKQSVRKIEKGMKRNPH